MEGEMKNARLIFVIMFIIVMLTPTHTYATDAMAINATLETRKVEREVMQHQSKKSKVHIPNENKILNEPINRPITKKPFKKNINKNTKKYRKIR
jgi:hypothetical protein